MLKKIKNEFNLSANDANYKKKFLLMSAHDDNLNNLLLILGVSNYTTDFNEFKNPT
jgi:hypothetical protein